MYSIHYTSQVRLSGRRLEILRNRVAIKVSGYASFDCTRLFQFCNLKCYHTVFQESPTDHSANNWSVAIHFVNLMSIIIWKFKQVRFDLDNLMVWIIYIYTHIYTMRTLIPHLPSLSLYIYIYMIIWVCKLGAVFQCNHMPSLYEYQCQDQNEQFCIWMIVMLKQWYHFSINKTSIEFPQVT